MRTSGARYRQPEANPLGRSPAGHGTAPSSRCQPCGTGEAAAVPSGGGVPRVPSMPVAIRTPVAGSPANSRSRARVCTAHRSARGLSSTRCGPQIAPATEEVVSAGGAAVRMTTRAPDSARQIAVVSPETPAPTTSTSQSLVTTASTLARPPGSADSEIEASGRPSAPTLNYGRAREGHPTSATPPAGTTARPAASAGAALAGGARPAVACPPPGSAGEALGDGGPGRDIAAVPVRGRARAQGALERDDRGSRRSAGDHAHRADRAGSRRSAPPPGHRRSPRIRPGHALAGGVRGTGSGGRRPCPLASARCPYHLVDDSVLHRRLRREDPVAVCVGPQVLDGLAGVRGEDRLDFSTHSHDLVGLQDQVRNRSLAAPGRLMQDRPRMRQRGTPTGGPGGEQHGTDADRLSHARGGNRRLDVLHAVVHGEHGGQVTPLTVDVQVDLLLGAFRL